MNASIKRAIIVGVAVFVGLMLWVRLPLVRTAVPRSRVSYAVSSEAPGANGKGVAHTHYPRHIQASGFIEAKGSMKIGSLVAGIIKKMHVKQNDTVQKGQLLAEIDDGKEDAEVRQAKALWERAKANYRYKNSFFMRQRALHEDGHISDDEFERALRDRDESKADVVAALGVYDKARIEFNNKMIVSPQDGLVVEQVSREGETVSLVSPATVIYTIAEDIHQMEAKLEVHEKDIVVVRPGTNVSLTFKAYPHEEVVGQVTSVSRAPVKNGNGVV